MARGHEPIQLFWRISLDRAFLADLPGNADPCGENGEFHTFVSAGPMFRKPLAVNPGAITERDGFVFADLLPAVRTGEPFGDGAVDKPSRGRAHAADQE